MVSKWTCNNKNLSKKCVSRRLYFYQFEGLFSSIIRQSSLTKYRIAFLNKWTVKFLFQSEMIKYTVLSAILLVKVYTLTFVRTVYDVLSKELRNWPKFTTHIKNKFSICFIPLRGLTLDHYCVNKHEPAFFLIDWEIPGSEAPGSIFESSLFWGTWTAFQWVNMASFTQNELKI